MQGRVFHFQGPKGRAAGALKFLLWSPEPYHFTDWSPDPFLTAEPGAQSSQIALILDYCLLVFVCACKMMTENLSQLIHNFFANEKRPYLFNRFLNTLVGLRSVNNGHHYDELKKTDKLFYRKHGLV